MKPTETNHKRPLARVPRAAASATREQLSGIENRLRSILDATAEFYGTWNPRSGFIHFNTQCVPALGFTCADWPHGQVPVQRVMHADDRAIFEAQLDAHLAGETPLLDCEFRLLTKAGSYRWFHMRGKTILHNRRGAAVEVAYAVRDIHARKERDEDISASLALLMAILQASQDVISVVDAKDFRLIAFNRAFEEVIFKARGVRVRPGMRAKDVTPEQAGKWNAFFRHVLVERKVMRDYEVPGLNQTYQVFAQTLERDGSIYGICIFGIDITNRKQMENALRRSEENFTKVFREAPLALSLTSLRDHRFIDVNDHYAEMTGYRREEVIGKTPYDLGIWVQPDARSEMVQQLVGSGEVRDIEFLYRTKAGEVREGVGSVAQIEIDNEPCMIAIIMDITERKRAVEALRESEERLRIAIEAGHMYAFEWDVATDAVERSEQSMRILDIPNCGVGHTKQELIDRVLPEDRRQYIAALRSVKPDRPGYKVVFRLRLRNGRIIWLEESGRAIFGSDGTLRKVIGITSDVTEVRESERTLRELSGRLITSQEEERRRIARELHDHIGQEAALLCVVAQRLDSGVADGEHTAQSDVHELYRRIQALAADVSKLSHRLHSSELSFLGLGVAAESLCRDFAHKYGMDLDYQIKSLPPNLDSLKSLSIFRVLEEALQNVAKHSHATHAVVQLQTIENELALVVEDNGDGFDVEKAGSGLGLLSMRERLHYVGGRFVIFSNPGSGTKVTAHVAV